MNSRPNKDTGERAKKDSVIEALEVNVLSFGYKEGAPPQANLVFDVRFLKNPYWVEELRPLTGQHKPVQDYVLQQPLAGEFLDSVLHMLDTLLPKLADLNIRDFTIAFGCTGGQHRSVTMVETLALRLSKKYPQYRVLKNHRELDAKLEYQLERATATMPPLKAKED